MLAKNTQMTGKTVLITGAGGGIGQATATAFAQAGADLVLTDVNDLRLDETKAQVSKFGGTVACHPADLTAPGVAEEFVQKFGVPHVLVLAAGWLRHGPFLKGQVKHDRLTFEVNILANLNLMRTFAAVMAERKQGHIIAVSSVLARVVAPNTIPYAASKHALAATCQGLRAELAGTSVKVTELCPGLVQNTNILENGADPEFLAGLKDRPYQALDPQDVAKVAVFAANLPANVELNLVEVKPHGQV